MMRGKATLAAGLSLTLLAAAGFCRERSRPNIIVITADAMRADMGGFSGDGEVKTPHLDALAGQGVVFERAYTNITTTTPSHATIFSSLYPFQHRAYSNKARISDRIDTLFEIMRGAGWHTAAIVNMRWLNPEVSNIVQGVEELARCRHVRGAAATNRWVLPFLDRQRDGKKPFLLWVHYVDTHTPYRAPGKYARRYYPAGRDPRDPRFTSLAEAWKQFPAHHRDNEFIKRWLGGITDVDYVIGTNKGSVSWLDENVGRLIARLRKNGQWDNTIFLFTADHGESLGEHGLWFLHGGLFEPTARIPMILKAPGLPAGRRVETLVSLVDVMPTLLKMAAVPVPAAAQGEDLRPLIDGDVRQRVVFMEHAGAYLRALVTPSYKLIVHRRTRNIYPAYPIRKGRVELYDLAADAGEGKNLADEKPKLVARLRKLMGEIRRGAKVSFSAGDAELDDQTRAMLRSLGYTE
ncbi:MAG: hypothetical protein DRI34_09280 [Deltaproteobacteria bacterium]|nr:MAG: hypothetical protein DRI34_09280 [Deltaproteobacteria bacterium]